MATTTNKSTSNVKSINDAEMKALREDYAELKDLMAKIQEDLKAAGAKTATDIQESSYERVERAEEYVRLHPRKAVAYAFGAGFLISLLTRR